MAENVSISFASSIYEVEAIQKAAYKSINFIDLPPIALPVIIEKSPNKNHVDSLSFCA
jgi:hypothetical protein